MLCVESNVSNPAIQNSGVASQRKRLDSDPPVHTARVNGKWQMPNGNLQLAIGNCQ